MGCGWASLQCSYTRVRGHKTALHACSQIYAGRCTVGRAHSTCRHVLCSRLDGVASGFVSLYDWGCTSVYLEAKRSVNVSMKSYERSQACCLGACEVRSTGVRHAGQLCAPCCSSCWAHALVQAR